MLLIRRPFIRVNIMLIMLKKIVIYFTATFGITFITITPAFSLPLEQLKLPPGFKISIYAHVPDAREMTLGDNGIVYVGSRDAEKVYALIPDANFTKAKQVITIADHLNLPNGVAYRNGSLYVAAVDRVLRYDNIGQHLQNPPIPVLITDTLPHQLEHGWRYIAFGPDGWLYFGIGAPCNICLEKDPRFATIMRMQPDGSNQEIYAKGVRNTVGFAWHPDTHDLWFTDNGRDWMGDNSPPDKLNIATKKGLDFGFPYYHGINVPDPIYGKLRSQNDFTPPVYELPAHVAPLGIVFYTGNQFPKSYYHQIFIAEHGSWNRSHKIGYQVLFVNIMNNKVIATAPFISGWLHGEKFWGRPVALLVLPDGSLLLSDDYADVVYRVTYQGKSQVEEKDLVTSKVIS